MKNNNEETFSSHAISNFKAFKDIQSIELAPITLIYGQNSGGKSTIIQSILALSQSAEKLKSGEINFSGSLVEAGTFETIQTRPFKKKNKIIFENRSNSYIKKSEDNFYIDAFDPIRKSKIRYYVTGIEDPSKGVIEKFEILFDGYLKEHKLEFNLREDFIPRFLPTKDLVRSYELNNESYSELAEINKKIINRVCDSFEEICSKSPDKLNIRKVLDLGIMSKTKFDVDSRTSQEENVIYTQLLNILQFAALGIGGYVDVEENSCIFYKLIDNNKPRNKKYLKTLKEGTNLLLENYLKQLKKGGLKIGCRFAKKDDLEVIKEKKSEESETIEVNDFELDFSLAILTSEYQFVPFKNALIKELTEIQYKNKMKKLLDGRSKYLESLTKISKLCNEADKAEKIFSSAELEFNLKFNGSKEELSNINKVFPISKFKNLTKDLKEIMLELDSILHDLKLNPYLKSKREIEHLCRIIFSTTKILESSKEEILKIRYKKKYEYDFRNTMKIFNVGRHLHLFANCLISIQSEYFDLFNFLFIKNIFSGIKNDEPNEEHLIKNSFLFLLGLEENNYLEFTDFLGFKEIRQINSELFKIQISSSFRDIVERFSYVRKDFILENLFRSNLLKKQLSFLPIPIYKKFALPQEFTQNIIHLGPARPGAKRFYTTQDIDNLQPNDVAYILRTEEDDRRLLYRLKRICRSIKFLDDIKTSPFKDKSLDAKKIEIKTTGSKAFVNIADTGYGLSQLLPIILNSVSLKENTIIIQQPETHLHPRLQAEIGTLMVESLGLNSKKRWIVETHSEIILLRILKLIRSGKFNSNSLRVYYIDKTSVGGSEIQRMSISNKGELLSHWPKGFFSNDLDEIFD